MIEARMADDLFTEPNEPKPRPKTVEDYHEYEEFAHIVGAFYKGLRKKGISRKYSLELTKQFLSDFVYPVTERVLRCQK